MTPEQKKWIDNASLEQLLQKWNGERGPSPWFQGDTGYYFLDAIRKRRKAKEEHNADH